MLKALRLNVNLLSLSYISMYFVDVKGSAGAENNQCPRKILSLQKLEYITLSECQMVRQNLFVFNSYSTCSRLQKMRICVLAISKAEMVHHTDHLGNFMTLRSSVNYMIY